MLLQLASAPVFIGLFYIYIRDKYEKEPLSMLALGLFYGIVTTFVIYGVGLGLEKLFPHAETAFYTAFVSSALVEEGVKFIFLYFLIWRNPNFNEPFDGIVYAVFISLGFAWIENLIYVTHPTMGGFGTAISRAFLSVPSHGLFAVQMGYWFARAKYGGKQRYLFYAFILPYLVHALYNYFLLEKYAWLWWFFWILQAYLWYSASRFIRDSVEKVKFHLKFM